MALPGSSTPARRSRSGVPSRCGRRALFDLGLEARYYRIQRNLAPDFADIERRIDDETVAVMSVNYFGFPQPGLAEFMSLVDEYECYHIDDNAHSPLSVDNGTLPGTRGDLGVTSLWKLLPIPDGCDSLL